MDQSMADLEQQYCPPLDSSLLRAILNDYDIADEQKLADLRKVLDDLSKSAQAEEAAGFDASGTSGSSSGINGGDLLRTRDQATSLPSRSGHSSANSDSTDLTEISNPLRSLLLGEDENAASDTNRPTDDWSVLPTAQRVDMLQEMFPNIKRVDISHVLASTKNEYGKAVEELLNRVFLEEDFDEAGNPTFKRGVEGFFEPTPGVQRKKKGKGRKRDRRRTSSTPAPSMDRVSSEEPPSTSSWNRAKEDIDFLSSRIGVARGTIASLYHEQGASLSRTIAAICRTVTPEDGISFRVPANEVESASCELHDDFPNLEPAERTALVVLTYPSTVKARELAKALSSAPAEPRATQIVPSYKARCPSPPMELPATSSPGLVLASHTNERLTQIRAQNASQAASAYRVSRSKPLMSGAAAYYSSVARDTSDALRERRAADADALIASQSSVQHLDLHGVSVHDAVRITKVQVQVWWETEGREWARAGRARSEPFVIVTGRGQHSSGGKGKLGPAVGAMLVREGWRLEIGEGSINVFGRVRR